MTLKTTKKAPKWEKIYDKKFGYFSYPRNGKEVDSLIVKSFIRNLLSHQQQEIKGRIEGMKKSLLEECAYSGGGIPKKWIEERGQYIKGYNQALSDILNSL